ncbi:MAG: DNA-binding protein [Acidobacteria bacterium]|nr:DNA-binding protein [Acidobacteriota bacterium]
MLKTIDQVRRDHPALINSDQAGYRMIREGILPAGVVVRVGRRMLINADKLQQWIDNGGQALPGGWRKGAE